MPQADIKTKVPTLLDRALVGALILVVLVLLGVEAMQIGPTP